MKIYIKWPLFIFTLISFFVLYFLNLSENLRFFLLIIPFFVIPGFILNSLLNLNQIIKGIYRIPVSLVLSFVFYYPSTMIMTFFQSAWNTYFMIHAALYLLIWIFYLFKDREIIFTNLKLPTSKNKIWAISICCILLAISLAGIKFVDIYNDSNFHIYKINYEYKSPVLTNFISYSNSLPFTGPEQLDPHYRTQPTIATPTYDFGYYHILLASFCKLTKQSIVSFIYFFNKFLFVNVLLAALFLGWSLFRDWRYQFYLFLSLIISIIGLKNYYNTSKIGEPPYFFVDLFHPTNISTMLFLPITLALYLTSIRKNITWKEHKEIFIVFFLISVVGFSIHKILFIFLLPWILLTSFLLYQTTKDINQLKKGSILTGLLFLIIGTYLLYYFNLDTIYPSHTIEASSLTESRARTLVSFNSHWEFFIKYAKYLENTIYKVLYFPLSFFSIAGIGLIYKKRAIKSITSIFLISSLGCFLFFMIPGMNYITIRFTRAFVQRMFSFLLIEYFAATVFWEIHKIKKNSNFMHFLGAVTIAIILFTVAIDNFRKGNEQYIFNGPERFAFAKYLTKNIPVNTPYLADTNSELEINASTQLRSIAFNHYQYNYIRSNSDSNNFQTRLNRFLYWHEDKALFTDSIRKNKIEYIIIGKKNYDSNIIRNMHSNVFNPNFSDLYEHDKSFTKIYDDEFHTIYKIKS